MQLTNVSLSDQTVFAIPANSAFGHMLVCNCVKLGRTMRNVVITCLTKWHILILEQKVLNDVWLEGVGNESLALIMEGLVYYWGSDRSLARMLTIVGCSGVVSAVASIGEPIVSCLLDLQILTQSRIEIDVFGFVLLISKYVFQSFLEVNGLELGGRTSQNALQVVKVAPVFSSHFVHQLFSLLYGSFGLRGRLATRFVEFI